MNNRPVWVAFLVVCFALTGLVGLFASYSSSIPLERALHRNAVLDQALASGQPDPALIRSVMGRSAPEILDGTGDLAARIARARVTIRDEGAEEAAIVGQRTRLMVVVVTVLAAAIGSGLLLIASRPQQNPALSTHVPLDRGGDAPRE